VKNPDIKNLYKYRACNEKSLSILINKEIWVSRPDSFNDPFDCQFCLNDKISTKDYTEYMVEMGKQANWLTEQIFDHIGRHLINGRIIPEELERIKKSFENVRKRQMNYGVFTLSESNSNILMWSHYADNHMGFCIEFSRTSENDLGDPEIAHAVEYSNNFPAINISDV
jgi:hypothetical protein